MVRQYKRKRSRLQYDRDRIIDAVNSVIKEKKSIKAASKNYNIPRSTLVRYCKKANEDGAIPDLANIGRFNTVFTQEQEDKFVDYLRFMRARFIPLTITRIRQLAYQYAEMLKINHKFNKIAGQDWYINFCKRHEEFKLNPRDQGLCPKGEDPKKYLVQKFFDMLFSLKQEHNFSQSRIYNVSENSVIPLPKIPTGSDVPTTSQYDIITTITCCNAAGHFIPPLMVFPAEEFEPEFLEGCPPDTEIVCHPSGWVQRDIFYPKWFDHFLNHVNPSPKRPVVLLISGCITHLYNLELLDKAEENHTHLLCVPSGDNFKLDPLECNFMATLRDNYVEECKEWIEDNPGQLIHLKNIGKLYGRAYLESATPLNAMNSFEFCGIYPFNRNILDEEQILDLKPLAKNRMKKKIAPDTIVTVTTPIISRVTEEEKTPKSKRKRKSMSQIEADEAQPVFQSLTQQHIQQFTQSSQSASDLQAQTQQLEVETAQMAQHQSYTTNTIPLNHPGATVIIPHSAIQYAQTSGYVQTYVQPIENDYNCTNIGYQETTHS